MKTSLHPTALLFLVLLWISWPGGAGAQSCTNDDPEIILTLTDLGIGLVDIFYLADFDPADEALHPLLFRFTVSNLGTAARELELRFEVHAESDQLLEGFSDPFSLAPGEIKGATNQELTDANSEFELDSIDISDTGEDLKDTIMETGYLPEGDYTFILALNDMDTGTQISICQLVIHVTNPRTLDPILPGSTFGGMLPIEYAALPQFQWQSQATRFNFRICPVLPGDASGEEVMENEPIYANLDFESLFHGTHSFLYPLSAEALVPGESYCWQVEALVPTSGGEATFYSDILCFEFAGGDLETLRSSLPLTLPEEVLAAILALLSGYEPTGNVTLDGVPMSIVELQALLDSLLAEGWEIGDVRFE